MPLDVATERALTPGCEVVLHLDHAAASLPPSLVVDAVVDHLREEARVGGKVAAARVADRRAGLRTSLARLVGARPDHVAVVENASRGWQLAVSSLARTWTPGRRILTWRGEYDSNAMSATALAAEHDAEVVVLPDAPDGTCDLDVLRAALDERVALVALTHVASTDPAIQPVAEVAAAAHAARVPVILDATQSLGQLEVQLDQLGVDVVVGTARKYLRGPRGIGVLAFAPGFLDGLAAPFTDLGSSHWDASTGRPVPASDATRFETWERSVASELGFAAAVDHALGIGLPAIADRVRAVATRLRDGLDGLPRVTVHDRGTHRAGAVTWSLDGVTAEDAMATLRAEGIHVSAMSAAAARWDLGARGLDGLVRASVHYLTTDDEVDRFVARVAAW